MKELVFDNIVITASNENQAKIYREQIKELCITHIIPKANYIIFADKNNERIGSGGSTLDFIKTHCDEIDFDKTSTLMIHSGGDSKRIPQYSFTGKLFAPVLKTNEFGYPEVLFSELLEEINDIFSNVKNGLVIASGDALITNAKCICSSSDFCCDAISYSVVESVEKGVNHGVFRTNEDGIVESFLHKCSAEVLEQKNAVKDGNVLIDTGLLYFSPKTIDKFIQLLNNNDLYEKMVNPKTCLNLYGDIVYPFAKDSTIEDFAKQGAELKESPYLQECREILFSTFKDSTLKCVNLGGEFVHFGTSVELVDLIKNKGIPDLKNIVCCNKSGDFFGYNSYISHNSTVQGYVENSCILDNVTIGKNSIVSGVLLKNIDIPDNIVINGLKQSNGKYCVRIYANDYNPKLDNGWEKAIYPVVEDIDEMSRAVKMFLNDSLSSDTEKLSLKDSCFNAVKNTDLEEMIVSRKKRSYLHRIIRSIEKNDNKIKADKEYVFNQLPVRANFAGGWTDTAPYTNDFGGIVINAAIKLNDTYPITCKIKKTDKIIFSSKDLGRKKTLNRIDELFDFSMDNDAYFIHQSGLIACGVLNKETRVCDFIEKYGGFEISTEVINMPKGNGLGTSSILCATVAKSIFDFFSIEYDDNKIIDTVFTMEQLMTTGGGWQDQIGGYIPGVKFISNKPGETIDLTIEKLDLADEFINEFNERFALIYTGKNRLARNLLHKVMDNVYFDDTARSAIVEIKETTIKMKDAIINNDLDKMAELFNTHFKLSKKLYSGTTNDNIEQIICNIHDLVDGVFICGAGGGGFLQVILKKDVSKEDLSNRLQQCYYDSNIRMYNAELILD